MYSSVCHGSIPYSAHYYFMPFMSPSGPHCSSEVLPTLTADRCQSYILALSTGHTWKSSKPALSVFAGRHGRWESSAEEMDDLPEGSAPVLTTWWRLPLQHNPRHICADTQPRGLEEHSVLWSLHISMVRTVFHCFNEYITTAIIPLVRNNISHLSDVCGKN